VDRNNGIGQLKNLKNYLLLETFHSKEQKPECFKIVWNNFFDSCGKLLHRKLLWQQISAILEKLCSLG
jgi:hypothetical protein